MAVALTPVLVVPMMLFAGFFVGNDKIPVYLKPLGAISFFKYGFQSLCYNEYWDQTLACENESDATKSCAPLDELQFDESFELSVFLLVCLIVGFNAIALMIMLRLSKKYE